MFRAPSVTRLNGLVAAFVAFVMLAVATAAGAQELRINSSCPSIDQADLGNMTGSQLNCACFHSAAACQASGQQQPAQGTVLTCGQLKTAAALARINASYVEGQAAQTTVTQQCQGLADNAVPSNVMASAQPIPTGLFAFERGYYTQYTGAKLAICAPYYRGEARIYGDGTISFTSGGHSWQGVVSPDMNISITREGVTNPRPKNDTGIYGPIYEASLFNGYCGQGYFRLMGKLGD